MKKLMTLVLALALVLSLAACGGTGNNTADNTANNTANNTNNNTADTTGDTDAADTGDATFTTVEEGKLIMSTNAAFPPYEMTSDDGGYNGTGFEGIDVEIAGAIAEKLGLELQIDDMEFTAALEAAQKGMSDMVMAGVTINDERLAVMDFTNSYATGVQVVIVKEGSDVTLDNLGEQQIGVQNGTTGWQYCTDDFGEDHVVAYDNGITAVQALMNGQVDCVIIDNGPAQEFVAANAGLTILETPWVEEQYSIGVNKGNTALLDAVNGALNELIADGTVQSIIDSYITAE